ncbi:glycoside hydrolase family 2 protein [Gryllotalpicola protaetiae]|uniref:beta-mannosidase n=1 Tax=Gryllotalpicola protaetiae TaxID=2419771 RepID=A0A387BGQ6_9MICO|nr:glycoside hydrolase family 2 protein [Gryllotalpicola protaetiae]AYG03103.1 glycoside hydrolase family 2 protein [Gryllotalpicola protaetiae]
MTFTPFTFTPITDAWTVEPLGGPLPAGFPAGTVPAVVPGVIHTDLLRAGLIADPFDGDNEAAQQWIGDTSWRYATTFSWHDDGSTRHDLVAYGLDTVARVVLNGEVVAHTENQHRSYRWPVAALLREGANELIVEFSAPVPEVEARAARYGALPQVNHHDFNQLRKTASHFGWDWGIDVAGVGIWQPIGIDSWSGVRIDAVRPLVAVEPDGTGVLTAHLALEHDGTDAGVDLAATVKVAGFGQGATAVSDAPADAASVVVTARIADVHRWWPIGHGDAALYDVTVSVGEAQWVGRVGFRNVHVNTAPDAAGRPFELFVNDELVLVRGVNWIPDHAFLTEIPAARYRRRLDDAVEANVNLLRVWGGGIYESDAFYERADELGLLVWQDFLFACAAYAEEEHLSVEVEAEAREQITRLSTHPSLVIWNGNNENIWGYVDWGWPARLGDRTWGNGYYRELFPRLIAELDPTRFYSPASPFSFGEYLHPNDEHNGTMHIWDVWNRRDYAAYRDYTPRFVSEFGFQGPPAWSTLTRVVHDEPLAPFGAEMLVHQKAHLGNEKLERGAQGHIPIPASIDDWHWATQLNQAQAIAFGVAHFRSLTPHNTGTVLWQLNDNWPVVSWAAVDFDEHRKPLWYALRDVYAPRFATIQPRASERARANAFEGSSPEQDVLALVLVNDTGSDWSGEVALTRLSFSGEEFASENVLVTVRARGTSTIELPAEVAAAGDSRRELVVARVLDQASGFASALWNPADVIDQSLAPQADALDARAERTEGGYAVTVTARSYVRDVFLQVDRVDPAARVDRGLVTLLAGESARFEIASSAAVDPSAFIAPLVLRTANGLLAPAAN